MVSCLLHDGATGMPLPARHTMIHACLGGQPAAYEASRGSRGKHADRPSGMAFRSAEAGADRASSSAVTCCDSSTTAICGEEPEHEPAIYY